MEFSIDSALQHGNEALKNSQFEEADRFYTAILKAQPNHPDANHNLGVLAIQVGKTLQALPFFQKALKVNPTIAQFWISYMGALIKLDRLDEANAMLNRAIENNLPENHLDQLKKMLGQIKPDRSYATHNEEPTSEQIKFLTKLYAKGNLQNAFDQTKLLLDHFPNSIELHNIYGVINMNLNQLEVAIDIFNQALKIKPNSAEILYNLGNVFKKAGDNNRAIQNYKKAVKIRPNFTEAYANLGNTEYEIGNLDTAMKLYTKTLAIKPNYPEIYSNIGNIHNAKGNHDEAIKNFKKAIALNPKLPQPYYNLGNALQDNEKLEQAIASYKNSLRLNPNNAHAHFNLGNAWRKYGKLKKSIESYKKTLEIEPKYPEVHNNLGNVKKKMGDLNGSRKSYQEAIKIKINYAEAHRNLGVVLNELGDFSAAIESYKNAIRIKPDFNEVYHDLGSTLINLTFTKPDLELQRLITIILDRKTLVRPKDILPACISLLKLEPSIKMALQNRFSSDLPHQLEELIHTLEKKSLLLKLMSVCPISDFQFEQFLTEIRSALLVYIARISISPKILHFQSKLALQCFTNEYVYQKKPSEKHKLQALKLSIEKKLSQGQQPDSESILCLASYESLGDCKWIHLLKITQDIEEVICRQVIEPRKEINFRSTLPTLREIDDPISSKVQDQYEQNPYPRWVTLGLTRNPLSISEFFVNQNLTVANQKINKINSPNILIAGCGTGQHSIGTATRFKNCSVLAIDLSLSSLAYAKRKTEELGIKNIEYMKVDILDLDKIDRRFDIVESSGVLHHMRDPITGWRILTNCLNSGGLMRIGLYSALARQHIVKIREEIRQEGIGSTDSEMKTFRNRIMNSNQDHHRKIKESTDFYSLSTLRDLLFHVQEHRFTIPQLKNGLSDLGLTFCGFEDQHLVQEFKRINTKASDPYDLDKWTFYEETHPTAFARMYQFWCQKLS